MKTLKRLLTLLVCFAAAVGMMTASPLAAEAGGLANFERINSYADAQPENLIPYMLAYLAVTFAVMMLEPFIARKRYEKWMKALYGEV